MGFLERTVQHLIGERGHARYIQNWLRVLRDDKKAIFFAAARASEAATYLRQRAEGSHAQAA